MRRALALARRALGTTAPNPAVGCVLVRDGRIIAKGATRPGGRPHGEAVALAAAGDAARGATAYVTLEPCAHHGVTPPCADALVAAGVARVVVGAGDPDPRVNGRGIALLRAAGMAVETGVLEAEARALNAGFFSLVERGRPWVTIKLAMSLDGRIATRTGASKWLTGEAARRAVHRMRACHDAVMTGVGTVLADDPQLTARLPGVAGRPFWRIVADTSLRTPPTAQLLTQPGPPVLLLVAEDLPRTRTAPYDGRADLLRCPRGADGRLDLAAAMQLLGRRGLTRVMVEAGGRLAAGFVRARLADRLVIHRAPLLIGGDGLPGLAELGVAAMAEAPRLTPLDRRVLGTDSIETYAMEAT